uniref:Uncharacterized protein n=1 Tax=Ditylenchus dipsaci TaxID=166011 RepID=A0A915EHU9_9BILA
MFLSSELLRIFIFTCLLFEICAQEPEAPDPDGKGLDGEADEDGKKNSAGDDPGDPNDEKDEEEAKEQTGGQEDGNADENGNEEGEKLSRTTKTMKVTLKEGNEDEDGEKGSSKKKSASKKEDQENNDEGNNDEGEEEKNNSKGKKGHKKEGEENEEDQENNEEDGVTTTLEEQQQNGNDESRNEEEKPETQLYHHRLRCQDKHGKMEHIATVCNNKDDDDFCEEMFPKDPDDPDARPKNAISWALKIWLKGVQSIAKFVVSSKNMVVEMILPSK